MVNLIFFNLHFSIDLLSEDLISSTSDDAAPADLVSLSPSPTFSSTPSPIDSQTHPQKPNVFQRLFNRKDPSYNMMFGSDNGINLTKTKNGM